MSLVLEKAAELADALEASEELKNARDCQRAVEGDEEANEILNSFFSMQQQLNDLEAKGKEPDAALTAQFNAILDKMETNASIAKYYRSQAELGQLLQQINGLITKAITGQDSSCTEDMCATCSGC